MSLPCAKEFPNFFDAQLRRTSTRLTVSLVEELRREALELLDKADEAYRLLCPPRFWTVSIVQDGPDVRVRFKPRSLAGYEVQVGEHEEGGFYAKSGNCLVRADSSIEALVGLGKLLLVRDGDRS